MHAAPLNVGCWQAVNGIAEDIEHSGQNFLADGSHQWTPTISNRHATGQALGGCQSDTANVMCVKLRKNLDRNLIVNSRLQQRMYWGQQGLEANINDTSTN